MANIIVIKHRSGSSGEPTGLLTGEIASNINDKIFCIGTGAGNIVFADKSYVDAQLGGKADSSSMYTQAQIDTFLGNKANTSDVYTRVQLDGFLGAKLSDAPSDTKQYVRQDGAWVEVVSGGADVSDVTIDGGNY